MPGGEAGAAAPAQIRVLHLVDDLIRGQLQQRAAQALVAVMLQVHVERVRIGHAEEAADHRHFGRMALVHRAGNRRRGLRRASLVEEIEQLA